MTERLKLAWANKAGPQGPLASFLFVALTILSARARKQLGRVGLKDATRKVSAHRVRG